MPPVVAAGAAAATGGINTTYNGGAPTGQPGWFQGAPITKLLCMLWVVGHVVLHSLNSNKKGSPEVHPLLSKFIFGSTGELVMGVLFLGQQLRQLERDLSSRQFVVWLLWQYTLVYALELVFDITLAWDDMPTAQGPYLLFGSILYWYARYPPRLHPRFLSVAGLSVSEKALQYVWCCYVIGAQGFGSVLQASMGFMASILFFLNPPSIPNSLLPDALVNVLPTETLSGLFLLDPPSKIYAPLMMMMMHPPSGSTGRGRQPPQHGAAAVTALPPAPPPSQEAIDQLTAMGFDEDRARQALQHTHNNIERAADRLLTG